MWVHLLLFYLHLSQYVVYMGAEGGGDHRNETQGWSKFVADMTDLLQSSPNGNLAPEL